MLPLNPISFPSVSFHLRVHLFPVGMVVSQRCIHLRQRQVFDFRHNLIRAESQPIPADNALDRNAGSGNVRTPSTNILALGNERSNINSCRCQCISPTLSWRL